MPRKSKKVSDEVKSKNASRIRDYRANLRARASTSAADQLKDDSISVCSEHSTTVASRAPSPGIPSSSKKTKIKDMTSDERKQYNKEKQAAHRAKKSAIAEIEKFQDEVEEIIEETRNHHEPEKHEKNAAPPRPPPPFSSSRKRNTPNQGPPEKEPKTEVIPESQKNVKIRLGWIDLFMVETLSIVIPYYGAEHETEKSVHSQFYRKLTTKEKRDDVRKGVEGDWKQKMTNYEPVISSSDLYADSVHITAPACVERSKFTPLTEAQLRATYFSILLHVDAAEIKSVAMPILGKGFEKARSVFVALQTFFYYFQVVEKTNLELVYIVTTDEKEYDTLMEFVDYIREIDLTHWTRDMFQTLEHKLYGNLFNMGKKLRELDSDKRKRSLKTKKMSFATMPGTDMVLRVIKTSHTTGKKKIEQNEIDSIHKTMCSKTSVTHQKAQHYANGGKQSFRLPIQYVKLPPSSYHHIAGLNTHKGFQCFPIISAQCGSYAVKRKLWFISYYYMYFSDVTVEHVQGLPIKSPQRFRELIYPKLKGLHQAIAKEWRRIRRHAPYTCNCPTENHENFMVFSTEMSHHDPIYHDWISLDRTTVFPINVTLVMEPQNDWIPRLHFRDPTVETLDGAQMLWTEEFRAKVEDWYAQLETFLTNQSRNTRAIFETLDLENFPTGTDRVVIDESEFYLNYQNEIEDDDCVEPSIVEANKLLKAAQQAKQEAEKESDNRETIAKLVLEVQKSIKDLHLAQWTLQNQRTSMFEQLLRNRLFRKNTLRFGPKYAELWLDARSNPQTVDRYLRNWCDENFAGDFHLCDTSVDSCDYDENMEYPKLIYLGKREYPCMYCAALAFSCETGHSCCKSGKVWINPIRKLPRPINLLFHPKYRNYLLGTNTAFSMASINYTRSPQAPFGVQSMKVKGLMSFHVSALRPHNPKHTGYANFIVLDNGNEEIANMRFSSLMNNNAAPAGLKDIFLAIQEYMDQNNCLMDAFKNMVTLEREAAAKHIQQPNLTFKIVSPDEVDRQFFKDVQSHPGVYANQSRMGTGYVTVAYSFEPNSGMRLPRGLTIYPKNPKNKPQEPISPFSENTDLMCFPLFHPDGVGGWQLHKYPRGTQSKNNVPLFEDRKADHIRRLRNEGKDPRRYWNNVDDDKSDQDEEEDEEEEEEDGDESFRQDDDDDEGPGEAQAAGEEDPDVFVDQFPNEFQDSDDSEDDGHNEEAAEARRNAQNAPLDEVLAMAAHEDLQMVPRDMTVGMTPNIIWEERGGDVYPVLDPVQKEIEIPFVGDELLPSGDEESDEEDPRLYNNRYQMYDDYEFVDEENLIQKCSTNLNVPDTPDPVLDPVQKEIEIPCVGDELLPRSDEESDEEDPRLYNNRYQMYDDYEFVDAENLIQKCSTYSNIPDTSEPRLSNDDNPTEMVAADDIEIEQKRPRRSRRRRMEPEEEEEKEEEEFQEDVCYGDELNNVELTELGRKNDGIQNVGQRQYVSLAEYANFLLKERKDYPSRFQGRSQTLGQLIVCEWAIKDFEIKMKVLTEKRAEFARGGTRSQIFEYFEKMVQDKMQDQISLGMLVTIPSTVPGTSKYQRELVMSAITVSNQLGHPDLFLTFTGNPNWPEIKEECKRLNCQWADIPEFVNEVFTKKASMFLDIVCGKKVKSRTDRGKFMREPGFFGQIRWYNYSVEFQQRGMPHIHLLVSLEEHITTVAQIDKFVKAELPPMPSKDDPRYTEKLRYKQLVESLMLHFPCENQPESYCNVGKKPNWKRCKKDFPKAFSDQTRLSDNGYPDYKRTRTNTCDVWRKGVCHKAGSQYVVSHSPYLLMMFGCHLNVEVVSTVKTIKYMFKYIHKGSDRVLLEATESVGFAENGQVQGGSSAMTLQGTVIAPPNLHPAVLAQRERTAYKMMEKAGVDVRSGKKLCLNDCHYAQDLAAITACEAEWKLAHRPMHGSSHTVHRSFIHEENNDTIYFKRGLSAEEADELLGKESQTMLTAWFKANLNPQQLPDGRSTLDLTFDEMFKFYKYDLKNQKFILRKKDYSRHVIGRIQAPQPRYLELTATRLLAMTVTGATSFVELRTFNGVVYDSCLEAARARRLMTGQTEWDDVIKEVGTYQMPHECRRTYVTILLYCAPTNPGELFTNNLDVLLNEKRSWSQTQRIAHALRHIQFLLTAHGMKLNQYELADKFIVEDLPTQFEGDEDIDNPNQASRPLNEHQAEGERMYQQLNKDQKVFVDRAVHLATTISIHSKLMFVDGPGGTGKTFCYNTIYHTLQGRGLKVACVAHTGIAACLLPRGCTAHRKFSIPLETTDTMASTIFKGSPAGDELKEINAIIWDEACMTDRRVLDCVDRLYRDLKDRPDVPFGGVLLIMGGDWRQILPIVPGIRGVGVVDYTIKRGPLWNEVHQFKLTVNQRASGDMEYSKYILQVGNGSFYVNSKRQQIQIPEKLVIRGTESDLIKWVFPTLDDVSSTEAAAILTTDNRTALRLNNDIIQSVPGELRVFLGVDTPCSQNGISTDPEVFASVCPQGMPPKVLNMKIGAQVVLLRNLDVAQGLCNGTRLTVTSMGQDIMTCRVNMTQKIVFLHRQNMKPSGKDAGFSRCQFPIRLAYACTVNKSQGQTLTRAGLLVNSDMFAHGQMYVAMSRVRNSDCFRICHYKRPNSLDDYYFQGGLLTRNVVIPEALE